MTLKRRRKFLSIFVEPYRQIKLGLMFLILNFIFSFAVLAVFGYYLLDVYNTMKIYFGLSAGQGNQILGKFSIPIWTTSSIIALFVILTLLISVKYTHAIYGPLVSIHRFLDDVLGGRPLKPLVLRESDQLQDLAKKLNLLAERSGDHRKVPMLTVYKYLEELIQGQNPASLRLRESDQFEELINKLNLIGDEMKRLRNTAGIKPS